MFIIGFFLTTRIYHIPLHQGLSKVHGITLFHNSSSFQRLLCLFFLHIFVTLDLCRTVIIERDTFDINRDRFMLFSNVIQSAKFEERSLIFSDDAQEFLLLDNICSGEPYLEVVKLMTFWADRPEQLLTQFMNLSV